MLPGEVLLFFLIFVTCPIINEKALSLICLPAPENTILSFLVLLCELSQVNPELDISWLKTNFRSPHLMPESGRSIPLQRQWVEWMLSCFGAGTLFLRSYDILHHYHAYISCWFSGHPLKKYQSCFVLGNTDVNRYE